MAAKVKVTYLDGSEQIVKITPLAQVKTEQEMKGLRSENRIEGAYRLAWHTLRQRKLEDASFDDWMLKIEDAEDVTEDEDEPDPTNGGEPSPANLSPSPSEPASPSSP